MLCLFLKNVLDIAYILKPTLQLITNKLYYCELGSFNM